MALSRIRISLSLLSPSSYMFVTRSEYAFARLIKCSLRKAACSKVRTHVFSMYNQTHAFQLGSAIGVRTVRLVSLPNPKFRESAHEQLASEWKQLRGTQLHRSRVISASLRLPVAPSDMSRAVLSRHSPCKASRPIPPNQASTPEPPIAGIRGKLTSAS